MADRVAHFMFEQTQRALERQATILAEFRQRTSMILSATGIVASRLGATALRDGHPRGLMYAALAATALGIGLCLAALRSVNDTPRRPEARVEGDAFGGRVGRPATWRKRPARARRGA
jgi:hypothetical protein